MRMRLPAALLVFTLLALIAMVWACTACMSPLGGPGGSQPTPIPPPEPGQGLSRLAGQIQKHPQWYAGQLVTLVGYFRGPDILDEVRPGVPPTDRMRDWVLKDDSGAIYVAGSDALPFPPTSQEIWRVLRVTGQVTIHSSSMPYITPQEIRWEELQDNEAILPAHCLVAIHRFGGPQQLDHHIYIYDNRSLAVYDTRSQWRGLLMLKRSELDDLTSALKKSGFFDLPDTVGGECTGCVRYYVAAVDAKGGRPHFVTMYEGSVPEKLQTYIDRAISQASQAKSM
jgi:hypothetical protein